MHVRPCGPRPLNPLGAMPLFLLAAHADSVLYNFHWYFSGGISQNFSCGNYEHLGKKLSEIDPAALN